MQDFTRRTLLQGGTALPRPAHHGLALLDFARPGRRPPWKPEKAPSSR
jgi:hypothetical protein